MSNQNLTFGKTLMPDAIAPQFQIVTSKEFTVWMARERISLAVSTYDRGAVVFLGLKANAELSVFFSAFDRAMGMAAHGSSFWLVTRFALWKLENCLSGAPLDGFDRVYVPRVGHVTGDLDVHDLAIEATGRPVFVNTRFNCLATTDEQFSFAPLWRPPFVSVLVPEDRCHLNGLALENGRAKYVTLVARSDVSDGWRDHRSRGGLVMDVESSEIIADGLSMPHSPRVHLGRLWLLNAGTGHFGYLDPRSHQFEPLVFLPGFARGLTFHGHYAIVTLSKPRRENAFQGLDLDTHLAQKGAVARCSIEVIDLNSGTVVHWARLESPVEELYDVVVLPEAVRPKALGFTSPIMGQQLTFRDGDRVQFWTASASPATRP